MAEALLALLSQKTPSLQTRPGLIVNSLQNDFISPDGKLPVSVPPDYFAKLRDLVLDFRQFGDVIWIRSQYDVNREINGNDSSGDLVMIGAGPESEGERAEEGDQDDAERDSPVPSKRARVSLEQTEKLTAVDMENALEQDPIDEELFLTQTSQKEACCIPGSIGAQFAKEIDDLIDRSKDMIIASTHYSAFGSTSLLLTLRTKFITDLFICGGPTNLSVYATAMDAARYGLQITLVDDCLLARRQERHDAAIKCLHENLEVDLMSSEEVIAVLREPLSVRDEDSDRQHEENDAGLYDRELVLEEMRNYNDVLEVVSDLGEDNDHEENGVDLYDRDLVIEEMENYHDVLEVDSNLEEDDLNLMPSTSRPESSHLYSHLQGLRFTSSMNNGSIKGGRRLSSARSNEAQAPRGPLNNTTTAPEEQFKGDLRIHPLNKRVSAEVFEAAEAVDSSTMNSTIEDKPSKHATVERWLQHTSEPAKPLVSSSHPGLDAIARLCGGMDQKTVDEFEMNTYAELMRRQERPFEEARTSHSSPLFGAEAFEASAGSSILCELLGPGMAETIVDDLKNEITWQSMFHQTGEVPRLVCCQGTIDEDGSMPVYRHPSDQTLPIESWTPMVDEVRKAAEQVVGHSLNHALIQLYRGGTDYISEHSDKTLDVVKDSYIVNVSFGAQRVMRLRTKRRTDRTAEVDPPPRTTYRIPMPHNSMIKMSLATNAEYLHGIHADKRPSCELCDAETAFGGQRISLTFRNIGTFLSHDSSQIFGQGATGKTKQEASAVINADAAESERLVRAFGTENQASTVQWDSIYGEGFNVLHLK